MGPQEPDHLDCAEYLCGQFVQIARIQIHLGLLRGGQSSSICDLILKSDHRDTGLMMRNVNEIAVLQVPVMKRIVAEEGKRALWSGLKPRILFHVPAAAICWGTYESFKNIMQHV